MMPALGRSSSPLPVLLTRLDAGLLPCATAAQKRLRRTVAASLCGSILHARNPGLFGTVGTAKGLVVGLNPVADDAATAMRAPGRHAFNCTFETVECHATRTLSDDYRLVIVVSAHITRRHMNQPFSSKTPPILSTQINQSTSASVLVSPL